MNQTKKLNTVRLMKGKMLRVGWGLLDKRLAGNRDLRFNIVFGDGNAQLTLTPSLKPPGWKSVYFADNAMSPCVSIAPFLRLYGLPDEYFPMGEFEAEKNDHAKIVVDFNRPIREVITKKEGRK